MGLTLGVAAMFIGVVFIIVGWKGGGPQAMETNLLGMLKGEYLPVQNPGQTSALSSTASSTSSQSTKSGATSTTGGSNSSQPNPPTPGGAYGGK